MALEDESDGDRGGSNAILALVLRPLPPPSGVGGRGDNASRSSTSSSTEGLADGVRAAW